MIAGFARALRPPGLLRRIAERRDPLAALLLDDSAGPALVIDAGARIVSANAALVALVGGSSQLVPMSVERGRPACGLFHRSVQFEVMAEIALLWRDDPGPARSFSALLDLGPEGREVRVTALSIREPGGHASGALLRFVDVGPQRLLEAQLAHSQKLQATGQLAGGIAHDFNNLLTAILGAAEEIATRERAGAPDSASVEDAVQIQASAQRGAALVRQLLAFGRQQTLQPQVLSVNDVIEDVSTLLRRLLGSKIRLEVELERPGRRVRADPTQLDQVIINLAVNGRDAMPEGGALALRSGHITLFRPQIHGAETIPPGRYVMIEVQDTGCGIPPDVLPRIFDPFFTTRRACGGSGLGLSTVHGIIRQSDGFLTVDSVVGVGTSMRIYLPRCDRPAGAAIPPAPPPLVPAARDPLDRGTILLVDDEAPVRLLAARALTRAGWGVISADSGDSALEQLRAGAPRLAALISDMVMPGLDGPALAEQVRADFGGDALPVVFVSGYAQPKLRGGLAQANISFLPKPYRLSDLVAAVDRITGPSGAELQK